jgi:hypothetical protein
VFKREFIFSMVRGKNILSDMPFFAPSARERRPKCLIRLRATLKYGFCYNIANKSKGLQSDTSPQALPVKREPYLVAVHKVVSLFVIPAVRWAGIQVF